jgi:hypothetical protein
MRRYRPVLLVIVILAAAVILPVQTARAATAVNLGLAAPFAVLGGSTVTNAGDTMVNGDVGVHPGPAVTLTQDMVNGTIHAGDATAAAAKAGLHYFIRQLEIRRGLPPATPGVSRAAAQPVSAQRLTAASTSALLTGLAR